jgi:hypothetical protein
MRTLLKSKTFKPLLALVVILLAVEAIPNAVEAQGGGGCRVWNGCWHTCMGAEYFCSFGGDLACVPTSCGNGFSCGLFEVDIQCANAPVD